MVATLNTPTTKIDSTSVWDGARRLTAYADPWTTPPEAFYDLYDLLPRLCAPDAHLQMEGRRGTGKTVLMVNSYLALHRQFEEAKGSPPYTVAVYVDLSQDVGAPRDQLPVVRAYLLYQQILQLILTASLRPGHRRDRRFWGLQDYLDDRPHWFRRMYGRFRIDRYRHFASHLVEAINQDSSYQHVLQTMRGDGDGRSLDFTFRKAHSVTPRGHVMAPIHPHAHALPSLVFENRLLSVYRRFGAQTSELLEAVLDALQIKHLLLFVDEWSGPSIGSATQPYLYEQLAHAFPHEGRVVLRLATLPGATKLTFDSSTTHVPTVHLDQLASFSPNWMRRRLLRMLISNLAVALGDRFPRGLYLAAEEEQQGYPRFLHDVFEDREAADELSRASESLPRQMLIQFMAAVQLRSVNGSTRRITAGHVRMAAGEHFASQLAVTIRQDPIVSAVFDAILRAGCRVVDVERVPRFFEALDWLANEGVLFRVDAEPSLDTTLVDDFLRYKLSYPAEVYRLAIAGRSVSRSPATYYTLNVDNVNYPERYPRTPKVMLSELAAELFDDV